MIIRVLPKILSYKYKKTGAKNNKGHITIRHRGGGAKIYLKNIDFWFANYGKDSSAALLLDIIFDSYRNVMLHLIIFLNGKLKGLKRYTLALQQTTIGTVLTFNSKYPINFGASRPLNMFSIGSYLCNIESVPYKGACIARRAGTSSKLLALDLKYICLKLPSGEIKLLQHNCTGILGSINITTNIGKQQKAGYIRNRGIRPTVRGVAMNVCDHPHGGGVGKTSVGLKHPKTPWGKIAFGIKTRLKTKKSSKFIIKHR